MKHVLLYTLMIGLGAAATVTTLVVNPNYHFKLRQAYDVHTIEKYTGETYTPGDCEAKEIYESDDLKVLQACDELEN